MNAETEFACQAFWKGYQEGYNVEESTDHARRTAAWMCSQWLNVQQDIQVSQDEIYEVLE